MNLEESLDHSRLTLTLTWADLDRWTPEEIFSRAMQDDCTERGKCEEGFSIGLPGQKAALFSTSAELGQAIARLKNGKQMAHAK